MEQEAPIGILFETNGKVEWSIDNFFSYTELNKGYKSPVFRISESEFYIKIIPVYVEFNVHYISLYLYKVSSKIPETFEYEFGIKTITNIENQTAKCRRSGVSSGGWGFKTFITRYKLEQKRELVPFGTLTIVCFLKVYTNVSAVCAKRKLTEDYTEMFNSKKDADVTLNVKKMKISAHKIILESRSPVFAAMFQSDMSEKRTGVINIKDSDPDTINAFLLFLYSGTVEFDKCNIYDLYKVADKYDVSELKSVCIDFMKRTLSVENFVDTLLLGHRFDEKDLLTEVQNFFNENFEKIITLDSWKCLIKKNFNLANNLLKEMAPQIKLRKKACG